MILFWATQNHFLLVELPTVIAQFKLAYNLIQVMYIYICIIYVYILKPSCRSYNPMIFHLKLLRAISAMICHQLFKEKHVTTLFCPIGKF